MKKWVGILVLCLAAVSAALLCLGYWKGSQKEEEQVVLQYMGWGPVFEKEATERLIGKFEKRHPNIRVEYTHIPDGYDTKIDKMASEGNAPDVAMVGGMEAMKLAREGALKDIAKLVLDDPKISLEDVLPQAVYWWEEGKACGINSALETNCLMYNKALTQKAGVEVPSRMEDAWSWEEFVEAAQKLTLDSAGRNAQDPAFDPRHIRQYGVKISMTNSSLISSMYAMSGEEFLDETGKKVNLKGTKALEGLQKVADLINVYHVMPNPLESKDLPDGARLLESGSAAMLWSGQWVLMDLAEMGVDFGLGVLPAMFGESVTISLGEPIVVFESTKYPKESWELAKAFMNPEYTAELMESGLWMPVLKSWYEDGDLLAQWAEGNPAHPEEYRDAVLEPAFSSCQPHLGYSVKNFMQMVDAFYPQLNRLWMGEVTAQEAAELSIREIEKLAEGRYPRD